MDDYMYWAYAGFGEKDNNKMEVELGSIYQINHSKLTPRTPVPLRSIRLVMVSEKTEWNVSVRYPSIESLKRYFNNKFNEIYPEMDQKFVMDRKLAERVLFRRVPSEEFLVKKDMEEFWLVMSCSGGNEKSGNVVSKKAGFCLSELKSSVVVPGWGVRRQVKFIGRHRELNFSPTSFSIVKEGVKENVLGDEEIESEEEKEENEKKEEKEDGVGEEEEKVEEEEEEVVKEEAVETYQRPKRKCCEVNLKASIKKAKKVKLEKQKKTESKKKPKNKCMEIILAKSPMSTRWSDDRYKQAQIRLLEVMKANGATCEKPILRPDLRAEARKKIGDTGLLDHLLKHVAGMAAPGGTERFRRRHNADGQMEYWLESAELVDLRREVGVEDPYWTPPPGWKVGDNPTQDPLCAQDIKKLKEETTKLKRNMKDMVSRKQMEKELAKLRREMEKLIKRNRKKEIQAIVVSNPTKKEFAATSTPSESDSSAKMEKHYKEQLTILSDHFTSIEEELVNLKTKLEEKNSFEQALIALTESFTEKEKTKTQTSGETVIVHPHKGKGTLQTQVDPTATPSGRDTAAEKAAKIERLKSGFRICKPQGTFLWPNSNGTNNLVVQVEDMAVVPTPPSVSSATAFAPRLLPPPSPVRPRPEKKAITVTVSSVGNSNFSSCTTTTTTTGSSNKTTTWINLNDMPGVNVEGGIPSSMQQLLSTSADVVSPACVKGEPVKSPTGSCSKKEAANWLALAAPADSVQEPTLG